VQSDEKASDVWRVTRDGFGGRVGTWQKSKVEGAKVGRSEPSGGGSEEKTKRRRGSKIKRVKSERCDPSLRDSARRSRGQRGKVGADGAGKWRMMKRQVTCGV
jgi:hypothetical protein